jgi:hypothetical protein
VRLIDTFTFNTFWSVLRNDQNNAEIGTVSFLRRDEIQKIRHLPANWVVECKG